MNNYYLLDYNPGTQQWGFPRRLFAGEHISGTCIMHTAECLADNIGEDTSAEGTASMIANRADWGSYHCLCDSDSIIKMAPWEYEVWGDTETNPWAVHISAALRTTDWLVMPADRRERVYRNLAACAAEFVVYMKATYGITVPLRRITGAEAHARVPGFCAHGDSGIARTDPGAAFDWALFFRYISEALTGTITPQSTPVEKEPEMPTSKRVDSTFKTRHRLPKGKTYTLSVADDGVNAANFAVNGVGHYVIDNYIRGEGLLPGQKIKAQFFITKDGKTSGHHEQDILGSIDGTFDQSVEFNRPVAAGTVLTCKLTSINTETAYVTGLVA
jgi:hypothetical protein